MALTGRVSVGFDANMLDPDPTWTVLDTTDNLVARIEVRDGRQTEQDETETGTATIFLNDTAGLFDPNNVSSPYFGKLDGKPVAVALYNPVDLEWVPQWRGTIDDIITVLNPATNAGVSILANVQIECVDIFDYLAGAEMAPGVNGTIPVPDLISAGTIFYDNAEVNDRITALLADALLDPDMYVVFSGNVNVQESQYDSGDSFLAALRDAADAEFPGIANIYVDKLGRFVFHGRFARLDPDTVAAAAGAAWDFNRWKAGDGAAITGDADNAQIREFAFSRPRSRLINRAISYPGPPLNLGTPADEALIPMQLTEDLTSQGKYGIHARTDDNLIVDSHKTNADDGWQQSAKYALFWVTYYADPLARIDRIVFKSVRPDDPRAAATWGLLTGVSISDVVAVSVGYPDGTGIQGVDYYVEGRELTIEPLQPGFDMVTLALNISPAITDTEGIFA